MKRFPYISQAVVCLLLVLIDQLTKIVARDYLKENPVSVIDGVFSLHYLENRGSIWGILQGKVDVLLVGSLLIFMFLVYVYVKMPKEVFYLPLFWIFTIMGAGAIGNTIDRIFFGFVTDFLYFELIDFPIFNVADCYLTVCSFLLIFLAFTKYKEDNFTFLSLRRKDVSNDAADANADEN